MREYSCWKIQEKSKLQNTLVGIVFKLIAVFRSCNHTTTSSTNVAEGDGIAKSQANIAESFLISAFSANVAENIYVAALRCSMAWIFIWFSFEILLRWSLPNMAPGGNVAETVPNMAPGHNVAESVPTSQYGARR